MRPAEIPPFSTTVKDTGALSSFSDGPPNSLHPMLYKIMGGSMRGHGVLLFLQPKVCIFLAQVEPYHHFLVLSCYIQFFLKKNNNTGKCKIKNPNGWIVI